MRTRNTALLFSIVLLVAAGACSRRSDLSRRVDQYDVIEEGSAGGVTTSLAAPGEQIASVPPVTATDVDTTAAFTGIDPLTEETTTAAPGSLAGTLPDRSPRPPAPAARPAIPPATPVPPPSTREEPRTAPESEPAPEPADPEPPVEPAPTPPPTETRDPAEPTDPPPPTSTDPEPEPPSPADSSEGERDDPLEPDGLA
ncbi:MAG TPA: hypothetical protein VMS56_11890 [Thermoanaerobaculia bacterium]|nr:hypothetical protein [Thermoanaerobaculia bacterium]